MESCLLVVRAPDAPVRRDPVDAVGLGGARPDRAWTAPLEPYREDLSRTETLSRQVEPPFELRTPDGHPKHAHGDDRNDSYDEHELRML
jgi:hypothetical protein